MICCTNYVSYKLEMLDKILLDRRPKWQIALISTNYHTTQTLIKTTKQINSALVWASSNFPLIMRDHRLIAIHTRYLRPSDDGKRCKKISCALKKKTCTTLHIVNITKILTKHFKYRTYIPLNELLGLKSHFSLLMIGELHHFVKKCWLMWIKPYNKESSLPVWRGLIMWFDT